jgi:hypothetical protein
MPSDAAIGLTALLGSAIRKGDLPDGLVGIGTVTWGFRGYDYAVGMVTTEGPKAA